MRKRVRRVILSERDAEEPVSKRKIFMVDGNLTYAQKGELPILPRKVIEFDVSLPTDDF